MKFIFLQGKYLSMKKLIISCLSIATIIGCKEDKKVEDTIAPKTTTQPQVDVLTEIENTNKTIFSQEGQNIIVFDANSQIGKISINGKEYLLNQMMFSENNYELQGDSISIEAYEGDFETDNECISGIFPSIIIKTNEQELTLNNVKVQDCTQY